MRIGRLRHRVSIQRLQKTADGRGGWTETWTEIATVWAAVEPLRGEERYGAQKIEADLSHKVIIRYLDGVSPDMRLLFGSRVFQIKAVLNQEERNVALELHCREIVT